MTTLSKWRHFLGGYPRTIEFPKFSLDSCNHWEQPLLLGNGEVRMPDASRIEYTLRGRPPDVDAMMRWLHRSQKNPYLTTAQFRLLGTDTDGIDWNLGWTRPEFQVIDGENWIATGNVESLMKGDDVDGNSTSSVENIFEIPRGAPMGLVLSRVIRTSSGSNKTDIHWHTLDILDSEIRFSYESDKRLLTINATTSSALTHPYAENSLAQPLRILFGQLIYPRLVARNFGDGRNFVSWRRTPSFVQDSSFAALIASKWNEIISGPQVFWTLYKQILVYVVEARDKEGSPNFEANTITQFYEEILQAARGTRWVWALTLASVIEGQTKLLRQPGEYRSDVDEIAIDSLCAHISAWDGEKSLRSRAIQAVQQTREVTPMRLLARLRDDEIITTNQVNSWKELRNLVMHGNLISPWSREEEDQKILDLANLVHALTIQIVATTKGPAT